jgi:MFS family permease
VSIFGASSVAIKLTTGPISDRAGIAPTMAGFVTVMCVSTVILVSQQTSTGLLVAAALLGAGYGGVDALLSPLIASVFGVEKLSSVFGAVTVAFALAGSIVPYAVGAGFDRLGSFEVPFLLAAVVGSGAIGALAVLHWNRI